MSEVQVFVFSGNDLREITDQNGDPWFVAKDVSEILGYRDAYTACRGLDEDEKMLHNFCVEGQNRAITIINESGLYSLILKSHKEESKIFKKWVTSEVLPSIRKTGKFESKQLSEDEIIHQALLIQGNKIKKLEAKIEEDRDKVQFFHDVTGSRDAFEMGKVAKLLDCGMGRNKLFDFLRENKILRQNNEPYQKYIDSGWFRVVEQKYEKSPGDIRINIKTLVYQKGVNGISKLIRDKN